MALPVASERKSYTFTLVSSPLACHSRPLFLKVPSSSFFLQSTEMMGLPSCSNCLQRSCQMSHTLARPFEQAHRIAFGLKQSLQIGKQRGIFLTCLFAPATFLSLSVSWGIACSRFHFSDPTPDGVD